jgi:hypothetical protein
MPTARISRKADLACHQRSRLILSINKQSLKIKKPCQIHPMLGDVRAYRLDVRKPERTATPLLVVSPNGES